MLARGSWRERSRVRGRNVDGDLERSEGRGRAAGGDGRWTNGRRVFTYPWILQTLHHGLRPRG